VALLTAQTISSLAVELLYRSLVLPRTASMIPGTEFAGENGDTITVRVRQPRAAKTQASPGAAITFDALNETPVAVQVAHLYDAVRVSDEQLTLEIADFGRQVLQPMLQSVAIGAEDQVAGAMNAQPLDGTIEFGLSPSADDTKSVLLAAREQLGEDDVPLGNRFFAVSPQIATRLLSVPEVVRVDESGSPSALRDAVPGKLFGFTVVESSALTPGTACAYHSSGIAFGNRAPVAPRGAQDVAVTNQQGIAVRTVFDFDASILSDVVAISTFAGAAIVAEDDPPTLFPRFIRIGTATA
jgi:hypothetical protein